MVLDYAISAQKYPKIVTKEKEKNQGIRDSVFQNDVVFYGVLMSFFTCEGSYIRHSTKTKTQKLNMLYLKNKVVTKPYWEETQKRKF